MRDLAAQFNKIYKVPDLFPIPELLPSDPIFGLSAHIPQFEWLE